MDLVFLATSNLSLTKQYVLHKNVLTKTPYPFCWEFTSHLESASNLTQFADLLKRHAAQGHCLLKGKISRPLVNESRAGSTSSTTPTEFLVLDLDGLPDAFVLPTSASADPTKQQSIPVTIDSFLQAIGLPDISYILQWSASYGIENTRLRAHIIMQLEEPVMPALLKQWLIHLNHATPMLRDAMTLTKTANSLHWPLDVSACQNDKLIYIAPPVLKGIKDPLANKPRISVVKRKHDTFKIPGGFSSEKNRQLTQLRIAELRELDGLPKRTFKFKTHGGTEVMIKPDACVITEMKQERGFVYFNLNGGDSWAYYHPENNPEFILNFKGEPTYLTKELLPEYWEQLSSQSVRKGSNGITYLAFCDRATSAYWRGTYDENNDELSLFLAKNETQLRHFALQYGMPLGEFIPEWDLTFNPHDNVRIDFQSRTVNQFTPSPYMKAKAVQRTQLPKTIFKVINHALGQDNDVLEHFINWLAFILQERDRTKTAWVMHGIQGTGKGILSNNILRPLFGAHHTAARRMEELNEPYNHFMKNSLLVFVDEVQTRALQNERGVMAKLKNFITEEYVPIRAMYSNAHEARNYTNWIFNSNMPDPVSIPKDDRRYNVAKYQPNKLIISDQEIEKIETELQAFHDYLLYYPMDRAKAMSVIDSADRNTMMAISETSIDTVSAAMLSGSFEFFIDQLPAGSVPNSDFTYMRKLEDYKQVMRILLERTDAATGKCSIAREELRTIYEFVIGHMPSTPNKFTSLLKHHRIHIEKVWLNNASVNGIKAVWKDVPKFSMYESLLNPVVTVKATTAKVKTK